jgi:hypothetical protein
MPDQPKVDEVKNGNNINLVDTNEFYHQRFKDDMGSNSESTKQLIQNTKPIDSPNTSIKILGKETAMQTMQKKNDFCKTSNVINVDKIDINLSSNKVAIADLLIKEIAAADEVEANGKNGIMSHRKPGDLTCLKVLSNLVDVAMLNSKNASTIFKEDDLKKLISIFCPYKLDLLDKKLDDEKKKILKVIKEGIMNVDSEKFSKSKKKSLENVMASTLQSISGKGRLGYKNATIFGRKKILQTIGKVLKGVASFVSIASMITSIVFTGGAMLGLFSAVPFAIKSAISTSTFAAELVSSYASDQVNLNMNANGSMKMRARIFVSISTVVCFFAKDYVDIVKSAVDFFCKKNDNDKLNETSTKQKDLPIKKNFIDKIHSFLDDRVNNLRLAATIDTCMQNLIAGFSSKQEVISFDINFGKALLDITKNNEQTEIVNNMVSIFSKILEKVPEDQLGTYLGHIKYIVEISIGFIHKNNNDSPIPEGSPSATLLKINEILAGLDSEDCKADNFKSLKNSIQTAFKNYTNTSKMN